MSYILEALKKAEAERQLGSPPGLHAAPVHSSQADGAQRTRIALWAGAIVLGLGASSLAWWKWPAPKAVAVVAAPPAAPVAAPVTAPTKAQREPDSPLFAPAPVPAAPAPRDTAAPRETAVAPTPAAPTPAAPAAPAVRVPAPAPVEKPVLEESYPFLRELPEPVARELPQVAIGGYIYSKNPAERLLLVDKVLRHEGEEVAPGLVLEKLLPKSAVFNYRGFRYRVAY